MTPRKKKANAVKTHFGKMPDNSKKRRKSTAAREEKKRSMKKVYSMKSKNSYTKSRSMRKNLKSKSRKSEKIIKQKEIETKKPRISSGFQVPVMDKLQAKRNERRKSQRKSRNISIETKNHDGKLARYRSLMKNKKQNIKQNQSIMAEDNGDNSMICQKEKLDENDVKEVIEQDKKAYEDIKLNNGREEEIEINRNIVYDEIEKKDDKIEDEFLGIKMRKKKKKGLSKSKKKEKVLNNEDMVKMLYFKNYASKSKNIYDYICIICYINNYNKIILTVNKLLTKRKR